MKLSFHGAAQEVTGSCHLLEVGSTSFLVDCGLFQGSDFCEHKNTEPFDFNPAEIDFVILTHAHIDHCGRLPKLYKEGFRGRVYATEPTFDFASVMLQDSARVIEEEAREKDREPPYTVEHVQGLLNCFETVDYHEKKAVTSEISFIFYDAGHILGSAFVLIECEDAGEKKTIAFSGDLGNPPAPIVKDTELLAGADYVVVESTYGGREHEPASQRLEMLEAAIEESVARGGALLIPAFALERTQEVLYELNHLVETKKVPVVPIFVDSPLAIKATSVYKKYVEFYDKESQELIKRGDDLFNFPGLQYTKTREQSKGINRVDPPLVVLAGSGMISGGRMPYHIKHHLTRENSHLLIISYQPEGGVGRQLLDGAREVTLYDEVIKVKGTVSAIGGYSSHADHPKLMHWISSVTKPAPKKVFIVHGEKSSSAALAEGISSELGIATELAEYSTVHEL